MKRWLCQLQIISQALKSLLYLWRVCIGWTACELYSDNSTKSDKIYISDTGVVFVDLHTSSGTKRTIEVGSVLPNIPNRFSLTVSGVKKCSNL